MRFRPVIIAACAALTATAGVTGFGRSEAQSTSPGILGFSPPSAATERHWEQLYADAVSTASMSAIHRDVTREPHLAGTPASLAVADLIARRLKEAGLETETRDYDVWLSTPERVSVQLESPVRKTLSVNEPASQADPDSGNRALGPGFVAYSASGAVTAPVLYVNYGLPPDYARLRAAGLDPHGKIVIARYGRSHRAVKVHTAQEAGAVGIIIYSDPADDGYVRGLAWPDGPWRADFQLQRGNAKFSWFWHGDPLSPGFAATPDARVLDPSAVPTLPRIPAVVLAYSEASHILSHLKGSPVPNGFQGGLPFTYRLGSYSDQPVTVTLDVAMNAGRRRIRNVVGTIRGRNPDRFVMLATHHDAWTFGGMDPGTGVMAVFEVARGLAALKKAGWEPERSLRFAFWDAEEPGLVGSTEYAEEFQKLLRDQMVTYINVDLFMRGHFNGGGTPSLRDFLIGVTRDVPSYTGRGTVYDDWAAASAGSSARATGGNGPVDVELKNLGSGADFVAFQDYLGLPTLSVQYDFEGSYGTYHSNYDTRWYAEHYVDPGLGLTTSLAGLFGRAVMRLGNAQILPLHYSSYATTIGDYLARAMSSTADPGVQAAVVAGLRPSTAIARDIAELAGRLEARTATRLQTGTWTKEAAATFNDKLVRVEQTLLDERQPARERWYRHVIYGWNIYSLYDGQPLPGLADAIRRGDVEGIQREIARLEAALARMRAAMSELGNQ